MGRKKRPTYTSEFKAEATQLARGGGGAEDIERFIDGHYVPVRTGAARPWVRSFEWVLIELTGWLQ